MTYRQFNERVDQLAWGLTELGLERGNICSIMLYNSQEFLEAYFAISKVGAITNPLNYRLSSIEILGILNHARPRILIIDDDFLGILSEDIFDDLENLKVIVVNKEKSNNLLNYQDILAEQGTNPYKPNASMNDVNMLIYTSGTTGLPKGVLITNNHVIWNSINTNMFFQFNSEDVTLATAPLFHIAGLHDLVFPHLHVGGAVALQQKFDPNETVDLIKKWGVTNAFLVPSMFQVLLENVSFKPIDLPSHFRMILSGAAPISEVLFEEVKNKIHQNFMYGYGMSEAGPNVCFLSAKKYPNKKCSIGFPLPHQFVCLVDENLEEIIGSDQVGELVIGGPTVFKEYLNDPKATSESKLDFATGGFHGECIRTGDLAYRDVDGFYFVVDRKKDMIISGGENVYCIEVENVLNSHPDIKDSAVIGIPHEKWGETVKAFVVPKRKDSVSFERLNEFCRKRIGGFKVPRAYEIVESIPRNPSGKILLKLLKEKTTGNYK